MSAQCRVGLVGCGRLAERGYLPAFELVPRVRLAAAADTEIERARSLAPGVPAYPSATALLEDAEVDVLVLAHAVSTHVADARAASAAGVVSLVEKPPARSAAEAQALVGLDPPCWMGFNRRFDAGIDVVRDRLLASQPAALELEMSILPARWGAHQGSGPVLLDLGPHLVDLALWLTGRVARRARVEESTEHDARLSLELDGGLAVLIAVSHARGWRERVVAVDSRGRTETLVARGGLVRRASARFQRGSRSSLVESLAAQLAAVAGFAGGGQVDPRLASAADGVAVMRVLDLAAAGRRGWVDL